VLQVVRYCGVAENLVDLRQICEEHFVTLLERKSPLACEGRRRRYVFYSENAAGGRFRRYFTNWSTPPW
jgi:hypothetical protein